LFQWNRGGAARVDAIVILHVFLRGDMHRHPHWIVAAALAAALSAPAGEARTHHHIRSGTHASPRPAPQSGPSAEAAPMTPPSPAVPAAPEPPTPAHIEAQTEPSAHGKAGTPAIVLNTQSVQAVLGKVVRSSTGEDMGRLVDVVVDQNGQPRAAIIDFGGFLGVGSRKIAVDWGVLNFSRDTDKGVITAELTRDQVKSAPEFKEGSPVVVLGALPNPPAASAAPAQRQEK